MSVDVISSVENLLLLISKHRWVDGAQEIAACLQSEYGDDASVFDLWSTSAQQSNPANILYDAEWAVSTWQQAPASSDNTIAMLHRWACNDNPVGFLVFRAGEAQGTRMPVEAYEPFCAGSLL